MLMNDMNSKRLTLSLSERETLFTHVTPVCKVLNYLDNFNKPEYGVAVSTAYILRYKRREKYPHYYQYYFIDKNNNEISTTLDITDEPLVGDYFLFIGCVDNHRISNSLFLINHGYIILRSPKLRCFGTPENMCEYFWSSLPRGVEEFREWQNSSACRQFFIDVSPKEFKFNTDPKNVVKHNKNRETECFLSELMKGNEKKLIESTILFRCLTGALNPNKVEQKAEIIDIIKHRVNVWHV